MTITRSEQSANTADRAEIADWAADLSDKFLLCREMGHNWRPWTAQWVAEDGCYERVIRCSRCYTRRHQLLTSYGEIARSHYTYPDGYQHTGHGRITGDGRAALRLESVTRVITEHNGKRRS